MANEKRLIDVNDAVKLLRGKCVAKYPSTFLVGIFASADEILKMPTVDAKPVVHGRWEPVDHDGSWRVDGCSVCGKRSEYMYNYCPYCGSQMDGGDWDG